MVAPELLCLIRGDDPGAAQRRRRRRAIIFKAIAVRFGHLGGREPVAATSIAASARPVAALIMAAWKASQW